MGKVRIECFAISVDGYGAGPSQDLEHPLGGGESLLDGIDLPALGLRCNEFRAGARATHVVWARA